MRSIEFSIPGDPQGKARHRVVKTQTGIRAYTPARTVNYERAVAILARQAMKGRELIGGPVSVAVEIGFKIPDSWSDAKKIKALKGLLLPTKKPDIDNIQKVLFDSLNGIVWEDDTQVVSVTASKRYVTDPHVFMRIFEINH